MGDSKMKGRDRVIERTETHATVEAANLTGTYPSMQSWGAREPHLIPLRWQLGGPHALTLSHRQQDYLINLQDS